MSYPLIKCATCGSAPSLTQLGLDVAKSCAELYGFGGRLCQVQVWLRRGDGKKTQTYGCQCTRDTAADVAQPEYSLYGGVLGAREVKLQREAR
jgi:hypothetical protein